MQRVTGANTDIGPGQQAVRTVDCDVHTTIRNRQELVDFVPTEWRSKLSAGGFFAARSVEANSSYLVPGGPMRKDATPTGGAAGSDPDVVERQLLQEAGVDFAILLPSSVVSYSPDAELLAQMVRAGNSWLAATWLGRHNPHGRYKGSIRVSIDDPPAAVREIEHWAGHPHIAQIQVSQHARELYGAEFYHPIWEAAARHGLPVAMHINTAGAPVLSTPVGFYRHYLEYHSIAHVIAYAGHFVSLISSGVFEKYPGFRFVFVEGGFSWVGPLTWRLDEQWRHLKSELPLVKRPPSDTVREQIRLTSQPVEELDNPKDLSAMYELNHAAEILMFSTDYPHWDYDNPKRALPPLASDVRDRIMFENACDFYSLPRWRDVDHAALGAVSAQV